MGTRACFFVGHPCDLHPRKWLGTIAFDGYPSAIRQFVKDPACSAEAFERLVVAEIERRQDGYAATAEADPDFPFPWHEDLFLTDYVYAWFDGQVQVTSFDNGFRPLADGDGPKEDLKRLPKTPAPGAARRGLPDRRDSIMILSGG